LGKIEIEIYIFYEIISNKQEDDFEPRVEKSTMIYKINAKVHL